MQKLKLLQRKRQQQHQGAHAIVWRCYVWGQWDVPIEEEEFLHSQRNCYILKAILHYIHT